MNYAIVVSTCAGMWAHVIGDTVRFESLDPPLLTFTGRTRYTLSAFGEHLISEEVEAAIAHAARATPVRPCATGTSGRSSSEPLGYHQFVVEFLRRARRSWPLSATRLDATFAVATPTTGPTAPEASACPRRP